MKDFTFVWKIKHFSYYWQKEGEVEIISPEFELNNANGKTTWQLVFADRRVHDDRPISRNDKSIILYLHRMDFDGPDLITLNIKMSFVKADKSLLHWTEKRGIEESFQKNQIKSYLKVNGSEILLLKRDELLIEDVLIVRCKMWSNVDKFSIIEGQCFARTVLSLGCKHFVSIVEEFSDLIPGLKRAARIKSTSTEQPKFSMKICLSDDGKLDISLPVEADCICLCYCKVLVLDNQGNWLKCGQDSDWRKFGEVCEFILFLDFKTIMSSKKYLQKNTLTLKCEVTYSAETDPRKIETIKYGLDSSESLPQMLPSVKDSPDVGAKKSSKTTSTLTDNLLSLYKERILCDAKLCTETEMFPAHKVVLGARSPVFKKMFTIDMREKARACVDIPDLKADTVRKLLMFMYTDTVEDMDWETAKELYYAADKYEIVSLKDKCSSFLKSNIQPSNCCEVLLLSDAHQDMDLKQFVQDYMVSRSGFFLELMNGVFSCKTTFS